MGQVEIIKYLRKSSGWKTNKQISDNTGANIGNTNIALKKLIKENAVDIIPKAGNRYNAHLYRINPNY